jgi:hypothetical protein
MRECDIVIDLEWCQPDFNQDFSNKKVFIKTDLLEHIVPKIEQSSNVTLVLHHSDRTVDSLIIEAVRPYCRLILSQNCEVRLPTVRSLPIGIGFDDRRPGVPLSLDESVLNHIRAMDVPRDIDVLVNFGVHNNNEFKFNLVRAVRNKCLAAFPGKHDTEWYSKEDFFKRIRRSKYVICPMGFGIDTHRFYEVAYLGARPVVITSGLDDMHRMFGAVILKEWTDPLPEWTPPDVPEEIFHTRYWLQL